MSRRGSALALVAVVALFLLFPSVAGAEPYLAGYVGVAIMQDKDIRSKFELDGLTPPALDLKLKDVEFDTSVMFGGKAVEAAIFVTTGDIGAWQDFRLSAHRATLLARVGSSLPEPRFLGRLFDRRLGLARPSTNRRPRRCRGSLEIQSVF